VDIVVCLVTVAVAYLLGSIPTGYLVGRAKGVDVRKVGSGNIGATNAFRTLGKRAGTLVLLADALKGWLAACPMPVLVQKLVAPSEPADPATQEYLQIIAGVVAILGHNYTCWLQFKGGKGIATSGGVLLALTPITFVAGLVAWIIVCAATRYVSLGSIAAALVLPVATWLAPPHSPRMIVVTGVMGALAIYKHKGNIERLLNGTESRIGRPKSPPSTEVSPP
jgi:glycerol-3-phosphate acyltransferase PlsY